MKTTNKTLLAATVFAALVTAAAPTLANDQLARSLGVEPGRYTTAELVILKNASTQTSNDARVFFDHTRFAASRGIHNPVAQSHFERAIEAATRDED